MDKIGHLTFGGAHLNESLLPFDLPDKIDQRVLGNSDYIQTGLS